MKNQAAKLIVVISFILLTNSVVNAQTVVDTLLTMSDGIKIEASYAIPQSEPQRSGWPSILNVPGTGGDKDNLKNSISAYERIYPFSNLRIDG